MKTIAESRPLGLSYAGKTAFITGASSGIGRSLALSLARQGCRVGLMARRQANLETLAAEIQTADGVAGWAVVDVTDRDDVQSGFADLTEQIGPPDLVIACAGVGIPTTLDPVNIEAVVETIQVNLLGVIYTIEAALPAMLARKTGQIAAISSLAAYAAMPGESAYCASKAAVNAYLDGLRVQVRGQGILVTTICPGFVHTPMTAEMDVAMPFVLEADEAADRIVKALKRRVKVYRFPWPTMVMARVSRWLPDWLMAWIFRDYLANPPIPSTHASPSNSPSSSPSQESRPIHG